MKTRKPIPQHLVEKTHITNEMINEKGLDIKEGLLKIKN
jgi:hypothetical protein